ncbi:hypothetical protein NLG97_g6843 [Lecanicillium saksenae]|uniref:Uncharacterized protein n=1 Tax=Lecanicillium saksenae TaxID=468837 RepID=A0ACC1QQ66_9HYPO|nr:hypothetical protein NLG97_g6843 [Lecanicillium saksenae]
MFGHSTSTSEGGLESVKHASCSRSTKFVLSTCTALYAVSNIVLTTLSAIAWKQTQLSARSILYAFIMIASMVTALTSGLMATRMTLHRRSSPADAVWVFKGMLFTLVLLVPLLFLGWTAPPQKLPLPERLGWEAQSFLENYHPNGISDSNTTDWTSLIEGLDELDLPNSPIRLGPFGFSGGIAGAFLLESAINGAKLVKAAVVMFHVNVFMGVLFAGVTWALVPWMGTVGFMCALEKEGI